MKGQLFFFVAIIVCICAYLYNPKFARDLVKKVFTISHYHEEAPNTNQYKIFTKDELATFKGENNGKVYLGIVGHVFDVTKGRKHYGPGGGYEFFAGVDASKAYVTGNFDKEGLTDDISDLKPSEILALQNWKSFYEKDYKLVGKVEGAFFDKIGRALPLMELYKKQLKKALLEKDLIENDKQLFPPCNSEWSQANGGRIWCTTRSGGIVRDWIGVPRMYYSAGSPQPRCACVRTTGPPSHDLRSTNHKDRGDLDNPNLSLYPNCDDMSESCPLPERS
ncbi:unnamed protein product [Lymnaea stagnalis]|uniref:Cytochrome b5 heme-binding domain-containing protein n=1 Tax=Lymnaea stagnalis TaxID=6523 RepID=A0AAV2I403_LYMST